MSRPGSLLPTQNRTTGLLLTNHAINAATGVVFWIVFIRVVGLDVGAIGLGYTIVAIGTAVGLVAKGGLGVAVMRHVPSMGEADGRRLLRRGILVGALICIGALLLVALALAGTPFLREIGDVGWLLAAALGALLIVAWLQDAYFLARGRPGATVWRNAAFSAAKLLLPLPLVLWAAPSPVAGAWVGALAVAALVGYWMMGRPRDRTTQLDARPFFRSARRNVLGNVAEFLPGLLLAPLVFLLTGQEAAGYFSIAWTAASLLFLAVTAIGRSALSEMVRGASASGVVRRALLQAAVIVVPGALGGIFLAPYVMGIFGSDYSVHAATAFAVLCASAFLVLPAYIYLDVLRAREATAPLNIFPLAMVVLLLLLAPFLTARAGVTGAAAAWFAANLPFALWATVRLRHVMKEVDHDDTATLRGHPHLE